MTPRKELFITVQNKLQEIQELEMIDLFRDQFGSNQEYYPQYYTAALIRVNEIQWDSMTENKQEGTVTIDVLFYCKDGWMDQHQRTTDPNNGLTEIDIIDAIVEKLQFLKGNQFLPMWQTDDTTEDVSINGIMSYKISFGTRIYRKVNNPYTLKGINLN